jgi:hypothetical protein
MYLAPSAATLIQIGIASPLLLPGPVELIDLALLIKGPGHEWH